MKQILTIDDTIYSRLRTCARAGKIFPQLETQATFLLPIQQLIIAWPRDQWLSLRSQRPKSWPPARCRKRAWFDETWNPVANFKRKTREMKNTRSDCGEEKKNFIYVGVLFLVLLRRVKMILIALVRRQIPHGKHGRRFTTAVGVVTALRQLLIH